MEKQQVRRFSLEKDFMDYSINDIIYGYLSYNSTFDKNNKERYIYMKDVAKLKPELARMLDCTARTVTNNINKMIIDDGHPDRLLRAGLKNGEAVYFLVEGPGRYQFINYDILWYLLQTRSKIAIKVYVYLLNKYLWKQQSNEHYIFTIEEIAEAMGYSTKSMTIRPVISTLLESFCREGLICWKEIIEPTIVGMKVVPVTRRELTFIIERKEQLAPLVIEKYYKI